MELYSIHRIPKEVIAVKKRIVLALLVLVCIVLAVVLIDPMASKPWTWANRLSAEDVEEAYLWSESGLRPLSAEETDALVTQINQTNRLHFQKNKYLQGPTPTCGITLTVGGEKYNLNYYGIFEMSYGDYPWWIRSERFNEYMDTLLEQYDIIAY